MRHWRNETRDMHRSALCRGAALLKTGGLVFDAELECRLDVRTPTATATPPPPLPLPLTPTLTYPLPPTPYPLPPTSNPYL